MKPLIWEISWSQNLAETGISVSLPIWILLWSAPMDQKEKIQSWYFIKKDNVMPVFLKSIKIYLGLEKEDQKAGSKKWSESVLNLEKGKSLCYNQ